MAHQHFRVRSLITEPKCSFESGAWSNTTSHQSPSQYGQYSTSGVVEAFISRGVPASNIYIGIPLYSKGFAGTNGLGSPATGSSPDTSFESGVVDYKALLIAGATEMWDDQAKAGYSFDATRKVINTYDVPQGEM
jgi:chitinase